MRRLKCSEEVVIAAYKQLRSAHKVADHLKIGGTSVYRVLAKHGINPDGLTRYRDNRRVFDSSLGATLLSRYKSGILIADLAKEYGQSDYAVRSALQRAGCQFRPSPLSTLTNEETNQIAALSKTGLSQMKIGVQLGRSTSFVNRVLREQGLSSQVRAKGDKHGSWKGGRMKAGDYWRIKVASDDPMAAMRNNQGYVLEHRLVMARSLGRPLLPTETVHHINGDCMDNSENNLQLRHGKHGKHVVMACLCCGSHRIGPVKIATED